jgi:hypothetical protein
MKPSRSSAVLNLVFLSLMTACLAVPIRARADEFVMPFGGYLSVQFVSGEAGGETTFGLGTSPSNFVALLSGLPNSPSSLDPINIGFFATGVTIHFGMFTTFSGSSGWAFSDGTGQASLVAFSDIDNSLGLGGSIIQQTGNNSWVLHLDDAQSYLVDDDDNDVLIRLTIMDKPVSTVPEPSTWMLLLSGSALVGWRTRRRYSRR